jgi:hypothetical protein
MRNAISIQLNGKNWNYFHYAAVSRKFTGNSYLQKLRWYEGSRQNIRDVSRRCLDVHGNSNTHRRHVHWYKCHKGLNQAWLIDQKGYNYPGQPLAPGVKFQIKTKMSGHRSLFYAEHIGAHQYRVRLQDNDPSDKKQWFTFDKRTQSIRAFYKRSFCMGNQIGTAFRQNVAVNMRTYKGRNNDRIRWRNGTNRNIRNNGGFCLQTYGNRNYNNIHISYYKCANRMSQAWWLDQNGALYKKAPLADGVKFQIRTKMTGGRSLFFKEKQDNNRYQLRIQDHAPWNGKQWFTFDSRTRSIRSFEKRNFAIATQINQKMRHNQVAIIQRWGTSRHFMYQKSSYFGGKYRNIRNPGGRCLGVETNHNSNHRRVKFYDCTNHAGMGWTLDQRGVHFPRYPLRDGIKFQIKTQMKSGRALFYAEHIGSHQYRLRIQNNNPYNNKQWFVFDWRTRSFRAAANRRFAMSIQVNGNNWNYFHYAAVMRNYKG